MAAGRGSGGTTAPGAGGEGGGRRRARRGSIFGEGDLCCNVRTTCNLSLFYYYCYLPAVTRYLRLTTDWVFHVQRYCCCVNKRTVENVFFDLVYLIFLCMPQLLIIELFHYEHDCFSFTSIEMK